MEKNVFLRYNHPMVIAEIGTSHGGDINKAFDLIDAAADAGADAVKFQWVIADEILHPKTVFASRWASPSLLSVSF